MFETPQATPEEPIGIVISRGARDEAEPKLVAYIWGQAEEEPVIADEPVAA